MDPIVATYIIKLTARSAGEVGDLTNDEVGEACAVALAAAYNETGPELPVTVSATSVERTDD